MQRNLSRVFLNGFSIKILIRKLCFTVGVESKCLKRSILEDLGVGKWPTSCMEKRKAIKTYVQNIQTQVLVCKPEKRFDFITLHVFDIRNRIFALDSVFMESKNSSFNQVGYRNLISDVDKFALLKETKLSNLSRLPICKVVMRDIYKANGSKKSL